MMVESSGDDVFESVGGDDSPMRLNGSSASSASVASRLYGTRNRRDSLSSDGGELISFSDQEMHENFLTREGVHGLSAEDMLAMTSISKQVQDLHEKQQLSEEERSRLKSDNAMMAGRLHQMEEQMADDRMRYEEQLQQEKTRSQEKQKQAEREKQLEIESLQLKYQMLEKDLLMSKKELEREKSEGSKLRETVETLKGDLAEAKLLADDLEDENLKISKKFKKYKEEIQQDIDSSSEMVEQLTAETEELKKRTSHGGRTFSVAEQFGELEECLDHARAEIRNLQKEREELQSQLLATSVERGHSLLADTPSLAEELVGGDSTQLLEALKEQELCNQKLRVYINGILMRVIERHPEILEVNCTDSDSSS